MRKLALVAALGCTLALGGCITVGGNLGPSPRPDVISEARRIAVMVCGFEPTFKTVADIFLSGVPGLSTATAIAHAICGAITRPQARRGARPKVAGVTIQGRMVRR
jgi:hypothetical protein